MPDSHCFHKLLSDHWYDLEYDDVPVMLVAHTCLQQLEAAAVMRRFARWLHRSCRLDLAHFAQYITLCEYDRRRLQTKPCAELSQTDALQAYAQHERCLQDSFEELTEAEREDMHEHIRGLIDGSMPSMRGACKTALRSSLRLSVRTCMSTSGA